MLREDSGARRAGADINKGTKLFLGLEPSDQTPYQSGSSTVGADTRDRRSRVGAHPLLYLTI